MTICIWSYKGTVNEMFRNKKSPTFISNESYATLDEAIKSIKIPHFFNRKPRTVNEFSKWKSSEVKLFSFYLSIPLLMNHIPSLYFCHYACYIFAIRSLYEPLNKRD
jgi:hypothetical protein